MEETSVDRGMDLQKLNFFTEGNTFTGSRTKDWRKGILLRYLVRPDLENGKLEAFAWTEDVCFERAAKKNEASASLTERGLEQIREWLLDEYQKLP